MAESCVTAAGVPDDRRRSKYPMINVEDAIMHVLQNSNPLSIEDVDLMSSCGRVVASDVSANDPFPAFRASTMDGYAVLGDLEPGVYTVQDRIHAGDSSVKILMPQEAVYITTGAKVPEGANAVVKIEDTSAVQQIGTTTTESQVNIAVKAPVGCNIRQIGCDIQAGELILRKGQTIGPAEVGILATVGVMTVRCYSKPIIGILSTGNELVNPWETPVGTQIRDSNRATLLAAFTQDAYTCVDLGIISDSAHDLEIGMTKAMASCNVVVTSGGVSGMESCHLVACCALSALTHMQLRVSMGDADLVKPMLEKLGKVHFGRVNMKPGKPATFATLERPEGQGTVLFFGLPGNPVSCLVTKALFIDPALKRLQGINSVGSMLPQLTVKLKETLKLDPERPEYHRATVALDATGCLVARSTGNQQSSRLLSMSTANALICLPQGSGSIASGTAVTAILTSHLLHPDPQICYHKSAACFDIKSPAPAVAAVNESVVEVKKVMRVGLLTVSDRASQGIYADDSGPEMKKMLLALSSSSKWPLDPIVECTAVVPDDPEKIAEIVKLWCDDIKVDLVLSSGGTGFGIRDHTPEAIRPLLHREAPGVAQALISEGLKHTPLAALSRPVVGTRHNTLVCTLPGSVKAVRENMVALGPLLPRIMELLSSGECEGKH